MPLQRPDSETRPRVSQLARLGPVILAVGLFLIIMLAAGMQGPLILRPSPDQSEPTAVPELTPIVSDAGTPTPSPEPGPLPPLIGGVLIVVVILLLSAVFIAVVTVIARALVRAWRDRPLRRAEGALGLSISPARATAAAEPVTEAIQRGIQAALREIETRPVPSDAIIAAWVGLEESAADAGMIRGRSETPGEFTVRIITHRRGIADDTRTLLRLYERVRFGGLVADESDRAEARSALRSIEEGWR